MSIHDLPRETIDDIVRWLGEDQEALSACSLAGRVFLSSCRYVMFVALSMGYEELEGLLEVIDSPLSTVAPVLRCLRFGRRGLASRKNRGLRSRAAFARSSGLRGASPRVSSNGPGCSSDSVVPVVVHSDWLVVSREVMKNLQGVRRVRLEDVSPGIGGIDRSLWAFLAGLRGVREVEVENGGRIGVVLEWACGLPELEELSVFRSALGTQAQVEESGSVLGSMSGLRWRARNAKRMRIPLLDVGAWDQVGVVSWLVEQSPVPRVGSLRIGSARSGFWDAGGACGVRILNGLVEVVGSGVEHLHVGFPGYGVGVEVLDLDLSPCDGLRSVYLEGFRIGPSNRTDQRGALEGLLGKIVDCAGARMLQSVVLTVEVDPEARNMFAFFGISDAALFEKFDWGVIPDILAKGWIGEFGQHGRQRARDKELVLIIQGGSKYQHERVDEVLRQGPFRIINERAKLSVQFETGESLSHGCRCQSGV